eukprot:CAMPEP_0202698948 /NCGR_PEP_ID=MMETSP1385-20130828/12184_1 /ASSEMBLY_ACC=CAM_ASM_000861 /TAXON_ID=933848 /ORGANISM="Elphidium margaritaceum" /LENGTH=604 /DNA_ID=CAMNT_0049355779 /DNA_START=159 /DNA_END=1973 /DNA_ORIENTATION=-
MDDMGWTDVMFNGGQIPTPNIDALHSAGISLTKHYIHLMCSQSRSQFLTGRYAMYMGQGRMLPWDATEIGGIPLGQPTVADWLKATAGYKNYAVAKWHVGYIYDGLLPQSRGFDHFFGFYQGGVDYQTLTYNDIEFGATEYTDIWEDGEAYSYTHAYASEEDANSMFLYRDKIVEYINDEDRDADTPFYMYLALQTMHVTLKTIETKSAQCEAILPSDTDPVRQIYCENILMTDDIVGDIVDELKNNDLWDNTLFIFTADNGADISDGGCNYPFRGTKGTFFDGNIRTFAVVSGGVIPDEQHGTERDALFSALDWTPTFLEFAGVLDDIDEGSRTWDGLNQHDLLVDPTADSVEPRNHLVLHIGGVDGHSGESDLDSANIVFEGDDGHLYKYMSLTDFSFWNYVFVDGWCVPDADGNWNVEVDGGDTSGEEVDLASAYDEQFFLFDLTEDVGERVNLLKVEQQDNSDLVTYAKALLAPYTEHELFHAPMEFLWERQDELGMIDGVAPSLKKHEYLKLLEKNFDVLEAADDYIPHALQQLYLTEWEAPRSHHSQTAKSIALVHITVSVVAGVMMFLGATVYALYYYCMKRKYDGYVQIPPIAFAH